MSKTAAYPLPTLGVDMLSNETALPRGTVREAVNVDIGRAGRFKRREGYAARVAGQNFHSIYSAVQRGWTLVAQNNVLNRFDPSTYTLTPLIEMGSGGPVSYTEYNGNVYASNRSTLCWLPATGGSFRGVGVPVPPVTPAVSRTVGALPAGKYGVTVTLVDDRGEEGGTCPVHIIDLPEGGGIRLSGLATAAGYTYYAYITSADGEELRLAERFPAVFSTYDVTTVAAGAIADTRGLVPMPAGDYVRGHAGRLYTAKNGALSFSEAMRPHLHNPAHGVIPFSGHIAFVEAVTDGMYVGDSRGVWFLSGMDPEKFQLRLVSSCRAVARSSVMVPPEHFPEKRVTSKNPVALWLSTSGYVVGQEGGNTVELQPERVKVPAGMVGRTTFLLRDGIKQVLTPVNSTSVAVLGTAVDSVIS